MNIKRKIYLINIFTALIPLLIISISTYYIFADYIKESEEEKIEIISEEIEEKIIGTMKSMDEMLDYLISVYTEGDETIKQIGKPVNNASRQWRMLRHMNNLADIEDVIRHITYAREDKKMFFNKKSNDQKALPADYDPTTKPWYLGAKEIAENNLNISDENHCEEEDYKNYDYYISEVFSHRGTGEKIMTVSEAVISEGEFVGVLVFALDISKLIKDIGKYSVGKKGSIYVVDVNNDIVIGGHDGNNYFEYIKDMNLFALKGNKRGHEQDYEMVKDTEEGKIYYHILKMKALDFIIVAESKYDDIFSGIYSLRNFYMVIILISILLLILTLWFFGVRFDRSLNKLSYIINSISKGNYSKDIDELTNTIGEKSELNFIKEAIKNMSFEIEKREIELRYLSEMDQLTNIFNRRALIGSIENEIKLSENLEPEFVLIMFDLDKFKRLNDTYGHLFGDKVLKGVCRKISEDLRSTDKFGRYGGEEFHVLLPKTKLSEGIIIAEKIRKSIEEMVWSEDVVVTISLGVIKSMKNEELKILLERVDNLLYKAKKNGRNRLESQKLKI